MSENQNIRQVEITLDGTGSNTRIGYIAGAITVRENEGESKAAFMLGFGKINNADLRTINKALKGIESPATADVTLRMDSSGIVEAMSHGRIKAEYRSDLEAARSLVERFHRVRFINTSDVDDCDKEAKSIIRKADSRRLRNYKPPRAKKDKVKK